MRKRGAKWARRIARRVRAEIERTMVPHRGAAKPPRVPYSWEPKVHEIVQVRQIGSPSIPDNGTRTAGRLVLCALALWIAPRVSSATTIISYYTRHAVYIGADSLVLAMTRGSHAEGLVCKIHRLGGLVWASSGIQVYTTRRPYVPQTDIQVPFGSIGLFTPYRAALNTLTGYATRQEPTVIRAGLAEGIPGYTLHIDLMAAGWGVHGARLSIVGFGNRLLGHAGYAPIECRRHRSSGCADHDLLRMGHVGRINAILSSRAGSTLVARLGPAAAIKYLISAEEQFRPADVGGPISIIRLDRSGFHWIARGLCR